MVSSPLNLLFSRCLCFKEAFFGVLLIVIFINDFRNATSLTSVRYVDDSTGLASGPNLGEMETGLQNIAL